MNLAGAIIIYLLLWWTVFFAVLPWGVRGVWEEPDEHVKGAEQGAPQTPQLKQKFIRTTWISAILWCFVAAIVVSGIFDFRQ